MPFVPSSPTRLYSSHRRRSAFMPVHPTSAQLLENTELMSLEQSLSDLQPEVEPAADPPKSRRGSRLSWRHKVGKTSVASDTTHPGSINDETQHAELNKISPTVSIQEHNGQPQKSASAGRAVVNTINDPIPPQFDDVSESEYSIDEGNGTILGHASSVRVSKPHIVENASTKSTTHAAGSGHSRSNSHSSQKAERVNDPQNEQLPVMLEEPGATHGRKDLPPGSATKTTVISSVTQNPISPENPLPIGSTPHFIRPTIRHVNESPTSKSNEPAVGLNRALSLPLPKQGLSRRVTIRPSDIITEHHENRASFREAVVTTPYPPSLPSKINIHGAGTEDDAAVSARPVAGEQHKGKPISRVSFLGSLGEKDRFPSPERPEALFLNLGIRKHPEIWQRVEIIVTDKASFDDEALFLRIKDVYCQKLLTPYRSVLTAVRRIRHVSFDILGVSSRPGPNAVDFACHFRNPKLGHKRKTWVTWLRKANSVQNSYANSSDEAQIHQINDLKRLSLQAPRKTFYTKHSGQDSDLVHNRDNTNNSKGGSSSTDVNNEDKRRLSTASDAGSFLFAYSPALPKLPFLSNRHKDHHSFHTRRTQQSPNTSIATAYAGSPVSSFFWPSIISSPSHMDDDVVETNELPISKARTPTIWIYYEFRLGTIALLTLLNVLFAILCAVIWIIFGVPGTGPGRDGTYRFGDLTIVQDWQVDAQGRVLVGVVIGLAVLLLGGLLEGALIWAGYVLL